MTFKCVRCNQTEWHEISCKQEVCFKCLSTESRNNEIMTDEEVKQMLETARKATQGDFKAWGPEEDEDGQVSVQHCPDSQMHMPQLLLCGGLDTGCDCFTALTFKDAAHIAACCPSRIIPLLEELLERRGTDHIPINLEHLIKDFEGPDMPMGKWDKYLKEITK